MYKTFTAEDYKKYLKLPDDYTVDGMLCFGSWDKVKQVQYLKEAIEKLGKEVNYAVLPDFLEKMVEFTIDGKRFWFDVSYGGALLSEYLHLACIFGSKKNILLGACGGLSEKMDSLDLIVPTWTFGNESATRMYNREALDNKHHTDANLSQKIKARINPELKVWEGETITCQAMLGETLEDVQMWSKQGFLGVEMEASTVFAVSRHFNVPSTALLVVADNLIKGEHVGSESYAKARPRKKEIYAEQYRVALEELLS